MSTRLVMIVGLVLTGQDARQETGSPVEPSTTLPPVEIVAPPVPREAAVVLQCRVNRDGRLRNCVVLSETPPGQGFGAAALEATRRSRLSRSSAAADGTVTFTTRFRLAE